MRKTTETLRTQRNTEVLFLKFSVVKFYLCFAFIFVFTSCNIPKDGEQENIPTSKLEALTMLEDVEDSTKKEKAVITATVTSKPILIARGSEPGWYAEFFADRLLLIADYGKDTISLNHDFSSLVAFKQFTYSETIKGIHTGTSKTPARSLKIILSSDPCTEEASGEKREKYAFIQLDSRVYKGCAYKP